jgi:hypothetical protein
MYGKLVKKCFTAAALVSILTVSIPGVKSPVSLIRTERPRAPGIVPASVVLEEGSFLSDASTEQQQQQTTPIAGQVQRLPRMRREAKVPKTPKAARPEAWGSVMRKEAKGSVAAAAVVKAKPEAWGSVMRKEARGSVAAAAVPKARPEAWGSLMRKEARSTPAVMPLNGDEEAVATAGGLLPTAATWRSAIGMLVALIMLMGFAMQVKSTVSGLLRASGLDDIKGKGK